MIAALCGLASTIVGSLILFPSHGHVGVAAAIAGSGWVGATLLGVILWRRRWLDIDRAARRRLPLVVLATVLMGAVILGGYELLATGFDVTGSALARLTTLAVLVIAGLATYVAALQALGVANLSELRTAITRRL
jgi:putative peptidoglycan lipid II flippase